MRKTTRAIAIAVAATRNPAPRCSALTTLSAIHSMHTMKSMMLPLIILAALVIGGISYAWQGIGLQNRVAGEEATFHALQQEYFIINKAEREAAPTGSALNQQLVDIQNYPSTLLELKLVGVGRILAGIFAALLAILLVLFMMPVRLAKLMKAGSK